MWPLPPEYTYISSSYGYRIHPITGAYSFHNGLDIPAPQNTDVLSVVNGIVVNVYYTSINGNTIVVRDSNHDYLYLHLYKTDVVVGQEVQAGQRIGGVGTTGSSTGNHLHFIIAEAPYTNGKYINPLILITKGDV